MATVLYHMKDKKPSDFEKSPMHQIIWLDCPKCGEKCWFPCLENADQEKIEDLKNDFIKKLESDCSNIPKISGRD